MRAERDARLRVIRFGRVPPLRSQTLWHAIAEGVSGGAPATLSFMRPDSPYVSVGYHHDLGQVDLDACRRAGLPVYRRMVGGGAVYLDEGQLFFQITVAAADLPPARHDALSRLLTPALAAFAAAGLPAHLERSGDILVGDRKVCGHGAGQIGNAVVVVGNLIERFDHETAAGLVRTPGSAAAAEALRLMRRYVGPEEGSPVDPVAFEHAAVRSYAEALGREPFEGELTGAEQEALATWDRRLASAEWQAGPAPRRQAAWQLKVRSGVYVVAAEHAGARVEASVVDGRLDEVRLEDPEASGGASAAVQALRGRPLAEVPAVLADLGRAGRRLSAAFAAASGGEVAAASGGEVATASGTRAASSTEAR